MDIASFIRQQYISLHQRIDLVMEGVTGEQLNWTPPGPSNSIGAIFLHMQGAEDFHIQTILQDGPRLWETGGWSATFGLALPPGAGQHWEETRNRPLNMDVLEAYQEAVRAATDDYLASLTDQQLAETVIYFDRERSAAQVLDALVIHLAGHSGEIAALKGIQGVKGLPF